VIETDFGKIKLRFFPDVAPKHVENFKKLAREGFYNGLAFHRVIPNFIIQGGDPTTRGDDRSRWGMGEPGQANIPAEFSDRPYVRGTLGAARAQDPDSATSQFFITLKEYPEWNGQYTVFGEVIEGLNVVQIISNAPSDPATQTVTDKVVMSRVYLEPYQKR
jgi:peptidyl-prolyl cis-trans isomerase B (cyclophilin B)